LFAGGADAGRETVGCVVGLLHLADYLLMYARKVAVIVTETGGLFVII